MDGAIALGRGTEMTPAAKITYLMAALIGLAGGFFLGFRAGTLRAGAFHKAERMEAAMELSRFSNEQYQHADAQHAREALLANVKFLEEMERVGPENTRKTELAMAYTRLALLEDAAQNTAQSQGFMNQARAWYKANGRPDRSDAEMKAAQKKFDEVMQR